MPCVAHASAKARSSIPSSCAAVPNRPKHASEIAGPPLTRSPLSTAQELVAAALLVACGGFRPQVELGAVGLDLAPGREHAKPHQREQQQLLHGADPFTLPCGAKPPRTAGCQEPLQPSKDNGQIGRTGRVSSHTGLSHSCT